MTAHDAFTAASPQFIRARELGNRDRRTTCPTWALREEESR